MNDNPIVILPEGSIVPEEVAAYAKIVGLVSKDGSGRLLARNGEDELTFDNMSKFFKYIGNV